MEPITRGDIIKSYEASRAKVFVYMAEALIDRLGDFPDMPRLLDLPGSG